MAQKLFVGGLAFATTSEGLEEFFSQAGEVASASVVLDRDTGHSRGFGFVEMATADGSERAVADLNGRQLDGRSLRIEVSRPRVGGHANPRGGGSWR